MNTEELRVFAHEQMERYGLLSDGWTFRFDTARRRFGVCRFNKKVISLSRPLVELNSEAECRDTVLHEIAHALAGPNAGHGPEWVSMCRKVGARPVRCYGAGEVREPEPRYVARCPSCKKEAGFQRRPTRVRACSDCCKKYAGGRYDERFRMRVYETQTGAEVGYASQTSYEARCKSCGSTYPLRKRPNAPLACAACCKRHANGRFDDRFKLELRRIRK